jgi:hypothetical protein
MAAKTTAFSNAVLEHILNNVAIANIGDVPGLPPSVTTGNLVLSLHTADPGIAGDQTTSEIVYTGYTRINAARDGTKWAVVGNTATNAAAFTFPACAGGGGTVTYIGIGTDLAGAGTLLYRATVIFPVAGMPISAGITPIIQISSASVSES